MSAYNPAEQYGARPAREEIRPYDVTLPDIPGGQPGALYSPDITRAGQTVYWAKRDAGACTVERYDGAWVVIRAGKQFGGREVDIGGGRTVTLGATPAGAMFSVRPGELMVVDETAGAPPPRGGE